MTFHLAATIADVLTPALSGAGAAAADGGGDVLVGRRGLRPGRLATMDDKDIVERINQLAAEEQQLEEAHVGEGLSEDELAAQA